jgi:hypothetical protein
MSACPTVSKMSCSNERMAGVGVNRVHINTRKSESLPGKNRSRRDRED